jgi:hypothetical protein
VYSGILPESTADLVKAVGATKVAVDLAKSTLKNTEAKDRIRDEEFYFLWRVRNLASK